MWLLIYLLALSLSAAGSKEAFIGFKAYRNEQWLTDFTIISNDGFKHPCHKLILSVASTYFTNMLASNMKEAKDNSLNLPYAKDTIAMIIDFIYDPDKTTIDKDITWDTYVELKEFADLSFIDRLTQAIITAKIILPKDFPETTDIIAYHAKDNEILVRTIYPFKDYDASLVNKYFSSAICNIFFIRKNCRWVRFISQLSTDGKFNIVFFNDGTAKISGIASCEEKVVLKGHSDWVCSVSFSSDGRFIITSSADRTAKIWDISGQEILTLKGHSDWVLSASFSPDGQLIITTSDDNTTKIWDISSGQEILTLKGHNDDVQFARFSPDGQLIITMSTNKNKIFWIMAPIEFYSRRQLLLSYKPDEVKSWLMLKHLLVTYLKIIKNEQPIYQNFISHSLIDDNHLANFILSHEKLLSYFRYLFKDLPY